MHDHDIIPTTHVRHKDGGVYHVVSIATIGEVRRVNINRALFGSVFTGTLEQARAAGFLFGDEEPSEVTAEEVEALLEPMEPEPSAMRQAWLACEEANRELEARVTVLSAELEARAGSLSDLRGELTSANTSINSHRTAELAARSDLASFKERVRNEVESAKKEHDLCIDGCNSFLEELGLPRLARTWKVTVTRDWDSETVLTVTGVKADNESDAAEAVAESFTVTATVKEVRFDYEYDGEGEDDWDLSDFDDDDFDVTDDGYAESHKDGLTFTAEEE